MTKKEFQTEHETARTLRQACDAELTAKGRELEAQIAAARTASREALPPFEQAIEPARQAVLTAHQAFTAAVLHLRKTERARNVTRDEPQQRERQLRHAHRHAVRRRQVLLDRQIERAWQAHGKPGEPSS